APLPRMATRPTTPDPAGSLAGLTDQLSVPAHREPAETAYRDVDPAYGAADGSLPNIGDRSNDSAVPSPGEDLQGPSDDPGLPNADVAVLVPLDSRRDHSATTPRQIPGAYSLRIAPDRQRKAQLHGATTETEAAVKAALKWLADNQSPEGRWNAGQYGAGQERLVLGRSRQNAGIQADTGLTGLTLLAFLASGHTHREGTYRENVLRGLQFLLSMQAEDGNLGGQATPFAKMYCHGMATLALSEAYGMTGDERLREPVRRAIQYTINAQDRTTGGFRYRPGDAGDTSQCGWQLMALKSAELAGIRVPVATKNGAIRYLRSVASGTHGGLSSYRPGENVTRPMTAEALVCWQFLGIPREHPALSEAGNYLLGELPGMGEDNLYYWYYATLGMYQLQGPHWQRWNEALQETLLSRQQKSGPMAGTWEPDTVWGGYGGRVFTTAMATLCLEVYYRFLPLYVDVAPQDAVPEEAPPK
ncbi:MAG TPA: prenyltransferase/squalene oxidase repeat-containing protein, partial [Thermoguttaceae bacterium]|nr:prenyltransferase/squalene oxidase repeat-containing protein [Thermoguttaceae bacterium]